MERKYSIGVLISTILLAFGFSGCTPKFQERHPNLISKYKAMKKNKALAFAMDYGGAYATGYGNNYKTIKKAKERAMAECNARRSKNDVKDKCKIYMVNDEKVAEN